MVAYFTPIQRRRSDVIYDWVSCDMYQFHSFSSEDWDSSLRGETVKALQPSNLLKISKKLYIFLLERHPQVCTLFSMGLL